MKEIVVIVRCQHCMHERKRQNADSIVFIASTLRQYAEAVCPQCKAIGMEIYIGEAPSQLDKEVTNLGAWNTWAKQ